MLIQLFHIGPGSGSAFRRSRSLATDANGVGAFCVRFQHGFQTNIGFPPGGEVVEVTKPLPWPEAKLGHGNGFRIIGEVHAADVVSAIVLTVYVEPVNVFVGPVKGDLQHCVKVSKTGFARKQNPSPDQRADVT